MSPHHLKALQKLAPQILATCQLNNEELTAIQHLVRLGLARDYASFYRRRTPMSLRLWGITSAGKAILSQQTQSHTFTKRPQLDFGPAIVKLADPSQSQESQTSQKSQTRIRIRSPQPPEGLKLIRSPNRDKQP